jgi:hypothetical protein
MDAPEDTAPPGLMVADGAGDDGPPGEPAEAP